MKRVIIASVIVLMVVALGITFADKPEEGKKGNGLPKEKSFNFNVIGVPNQKNWDPDSYDTGGNGKRIFILRSGSTSVYVHGADGPPEILDHDGTDGKVGWGKDNPGILLPYVGEDGDGYWDCRVYIRLLGKPGGQIDWTTKVFDDGDYVEVASFPLKRDKFAKFQIQGSNILRDNYQDILWEWDANQHFRLMQFRIFMGAPEGNYPGGNTPQE